MEPAEVPRQLPRYDFYQTPTHLILSLYIKGYGAPEIKDKVVVKFEDRQIIVDLPPLEKDGQPSTPQRIDLQPLTASIVPDQSSSRVLSTKIELKLAKAVPENWSALLSTTPIGAFPSGQGQTGPSNPSSSIPAPQAGSSAAAAVPTTSLPAPKAKKNWDKLIDEDEKGPKDPNEGGDSALKDFFAKIYGDADEDTKRAMIKSYTESGGTALSTDWSKIGKEKTEIRPPEGMEARKYD